MINIEEIRQIVKKPLYEYEKFHLKTKFKKLPKNTNSKFWPKEWKEIYYKGYLRFPELMLPKPNLKKRISFKSVLLNRKSSREFSRLPLNQEEISTLLYYSAGIINNRNNPKKRRYYPSGGGRFPLELYLVSINSEIPKGIYHYYVKNNSLEKLANFKKRDLKKITQLNWVNDAGCLIILTAVFRRNVIKYGERGYRHVLAETGHLGQNLYLVSSALEISCCAIGGYHDDEVNSLLDVDGIGETALYLFAAGKKKR